MSRHHHLLLVSSEEPPIGAALEEGEANLRSLLQHSRDVIYRFNLKANRFEYISPVAEAIVGFSVDELMALDEEAAFSKIHPDDRPVMLKAIACLSEAGLAEAEYRQLCKGGGYRWLSNKMSLTRDDAGNPLYRNGSIRDVTDLKQAEAALRESEQRHVFLLKLSDTLRSLSEATDTMAASAQLIGQHLGVAYAGYAAVDAASFVKTEGEYFQDGEKPILTGKAYSLDGLGVKSANRLWKGETAYEEDILTADGFSDGERSAMTGMGVRSYIAVPGLYSGRLEACFLAAHDCQRTWSQHEIALVRNTAESTFAAVQRCHANKALRESEERYRQLAEAMPQLVWTANSDGAVDYCNARVAEFGIPITSPPTNDDWAPAVHPDDLAPTREAWRAAVARGQTYEKEHRLLMADGGYRWHLSRGQPQRNEEGNIVKWFGTTTDINDLKRAESALRETAATLLHAQRCANAGIWDVDLVKNRVAWSEPYYELYGLPRGVKPSHESWIASIHPDDQERVDAEFAQALYSCTAQHIEFRIRRDGEVRWLRSKGRVIHDGANHPVRITGIAWDITERKRAEAALRESEERLRRLGDSLPDSAIYRYSHEVDGSLRFHYISAGIESMNGVRVEDALRDAGALHRQIPPDYFPKLVEAERLSAHEMSDFEMEVPMRRPDGELRWMRLQSRPHRMEDGSVIWDGVQTDITERKRAEEALRESAATLLHAQRCAGAGVWDIDFANNRVAWSEPYYELYGLPCSVKPSHESWIASIHPDDRERVDAEFARAVAGRGVQRIEFRILRDGRVHWLHSEGRVFCDSANRPVRVTGITLDITERKRTEEALRESEARARTLLEGMAQAFWETDAEGNVVTDSPSWRAYTGQCIDEWMGYGWLNAIHPEDRAHTERSWREAVAARRRFYEEYRLRAPDGGYRWTNVRATPLLNEDGSIQKWVGMNIDIEELKQADQRRALVEAELSQALRSTVESQEAERLRIARELHDRLGQTLTLLQLGLDELGHALPEGDKMRERLAALVGLANNLGSEANRLAWEIRPTALDDLGLEIAIRHLVETWSERSHLEFDLQLMLNDRRLNPAVETALYRVLQEAITNIARHADATGVAVLLEAHEKEVSMIVEDDGRGFSLAEALPPGAPSKRLGLLGIRERLSLVSGTLEVESAPGEGCTLYIRAPL